MPAKSLVLSPCPPGERYVEMAKDFPHFGRVKTPVVLPPPSQNGVVVSREGSKTLGRLTRQMPLGDLLPHPRLGRTARPRQEACEEFPCAVLRPPWSEREAQEGKLNRGIVALAGDVPKWLILLILDSQAELKPIDEQSDHCLVHLDGSREANGFSHEPFDPRA
jgi:hypothetical protein